MHDHPPKTQTDRLHTDIKDMYELDPADRYSFVSSFMKNDELYHLPQPTKVERITSHYIRDTKTVKGEGVTEAGLPAIFTSGDHLFTKLEQCKILDIDTTHQVPYLRANLSVCSVVIARHQDRLWAAHLGLSEVSQLNHALEQLHDAGFEEKDCIVIASVGGAQEANNAANLSPRLASKDDYIKHGFLPDAITTFEWTPPSTPEDRTQRGLCEVIIGTDGQLVTTFDADIYFQHGFMQEKIYTDTEKEAFIAA